MVGRRFSARDLPAYVVAQVLGGMAGAGVLYVIATGKPGFELGGFACNGFAENSPGGYSLEACLVAEVVLTFMFLMIVLGSTDRRAPQGFAPIAIGLALLAGANCRRGARGHRLSPYCRRRRARARDSKEGGQQGGIEPAGVVAPCHALFRYRTCADCGADPWCRVPNGDDAPSACALRLCRFH